MSLQVLDLVDYKNMVCEIINILGDELVIKPLFDYSSKYHTYRNINVSKKRVQIKDNSYHRLVLKSLR